MTPAAIIILLSFVALFFWALYNHPLKVIVAVVAIMVWSVHGIEYSCRDEAIPVDNCPKNKLEHRIKTW